MVKIKITIENIPAGSEPEIIFKCNETDYELLELMHSIKSSSKKLIGIKDSKINMINPEEVYYFESVDNKVFIYCESEVYESRLRLYEIESEYEDGYFFRSSKSTILNIKKIKSISPIFYSKFEALLLNNETVIISRQYVPQLKKRLGL